jgi:hypothetical protein
VSLSVSPFVPPVGLVLGVVALRRIRRTRERGRALAWLGIAVSTVTTLVGLVRWLPTLL